jgi:hypothetical protein
MENDHHRDTENTEETHRDFETGHHYLLTQNVETDRELTLQMLAHERRNLPGVNRLPG